MLLLLLGTFLLLIWGLTGSWSRLLIVIMQSATLIAALMAAQTAPRLQRLAWLLAIVAILTSLVTIPINETLSEATDAVISGLLVAVAPVAIAASIVKRRVIDVQTVLGALCIYVFVGLLFAFLYTMIGAIGSNPFFVQETKAATTSSDYVYFSFVTLTTTGYGDLTAAENVGRGFAVMEALLGQIYLVTIVALLVSNLGPRRRANAESNAESTEQ